MGINRYKIKNRSAGIQLFLKLFLGLIIGASPTVLQAQEMNQNAVSNGAGLVSGGDYTGYASAGQMATYMYANGTQIATQGIILNEISGDVEFTFELSGNLTENEDLNSGVMMMKAAKIALAGSPLANTKVFLLDTETGEILYETITDAVGFFKFPNIPYRNFHFTVGSSEVPAEPVLLSFESNIFIKKIEINGELGSAGVSAAVTVVPENTCSPSNPNYKIWYLDADKDGFGNAKYSVGQCTKPTGYVLNNLDCNDKNAVINPNAVDIPGSGIDSNCDGYYEWYKDVDGDGYGSETIIFSLNVSPDLGESSNNSDCDDSNAKINPAASDSGGEDLNCNGVIECSGISNLVFDAPTEPVEISNAITLSITLEGNGTNSAVLDWGDETSILVDISEGFITGVHSYTSAGVYTLSLTLDDDCGLTNTFAYKYIVIYDPTSGFVTGSGTIFSPAGASELYPSETGIATFGFVSKYVKNKTVPIGNTEFEFEAGDLNFASTEYEWLVIAGSKAKFKGRGSINGIPGYQFMISAIDGDINSKGNPDLFRIKIWNESTGDVVYDNQMDAEIDADPTTVISSGSIKIHTPKTKSESLSTSAELENSEGEGFIVYPNPTSGIVKINGFYTDRDYLIKVIDMNGREIEIKNNNDFETEIDLTNYPKGIYNLIVQYKTEIQTYSIIRN